MNVILRNIAVSLSVMGLVLFPVSCRKDLCYNHEEHSYSVKVNMVSEWEQEWERAYDYDWKQLWNGEWNRAYDDLRPEPADGIRVQVYTDDGQNIESNLSAEGGRLSMPEGTHDLLFYNNDTEYIVFEGITASVSATATTRSITRGSFKELHAGERTVNQPDMLYGAYVEGHVAEKTLVPTELPVTLHPLVYTYMIRYEFEQGREYVALARGALAGMAESVYLNDGHTDGKTATVMFDCTVEDYGAEALVQSFGVPAYPGEYYGRGEGDDITEERYYTLNLEVRMTNGKFKTFEFDVTKQVKGQPRGGVIVVKGLKITDEEGGGVGGGFDVNVDGWGDYIDIPLPIN